MRILGLLLTAILAGSLPASASDGSRTVPPTPGSRRTPPAVQASISRLPLTFEANRGQAPEGTAFLARGSGWSASILREGVRFGFDGRPEAAVTMRVRDARPDPAVSGIDALPCRSNYFLGNDPAAWRTGIPHYAVVRASGVLPGVALLWRGLPGGRLRYDLEIAPHADRNRLFLDFEGARSVCSDANGDLIVDAAAGSMRHSRPVAWQESGGRRIPVPCRFEAGNRSARIVLGPHDAALPVIVDPTVQVSSHYGAGDVTRGHGCAVDSSGNVYLNGFTNQSGYATAGAYQTARSGSDDVYVMKLAPGGSTVLYYTYLGGTSSDRYPYMTVDASGAVYVAGETGSSDFPVKFPLQSYGGANDGFVAKIGPSGGTLEFSTYIGGTAREIAAGITVARDGTVWACGLTASDNFVRVNAIDTVRNGDEAFLVRLSADGKSLLFSSYLGGNGTEYLFGVAAADDGTIWAAGYTNSTNFPLASPVQDTYGGGAEDAIVVAVSQDGSDLLFSTYLGGSEFEEATAIAVDLMGRPVVTGWTVSTDFPTAAALQDSNAAGADAFVWKYDPVDQEVLFSTFLGGDGADYGYGVATDPESDIYVTGNTASSDFPLSSALDANRGGNNDMFLSKISSDGATLLFSTYHGGTTGESAQGGENNSDDVPRSVAVDGSIAVIAGETDSIDYPKVDGIAGSWTGQHCGAFAVFSFLPAPFRALHVESATANDVAIAWTDPHGGAYDVEVQRKSGTGAGAFSTVANLDAGTTEWAEGDLTEDKFYVYRVRGTSGGGNTGWAVTTVQTQLNPPSSPSILDNQNDTVTVGWSDESSVETSYAVYRRLAGLGASFALIATKPAGSTSHADATVAAEKTYEYRVRTKGPSGAVADSTIVQVLTPPPNATQFSVQSVTDVSATLLWLDNAVFETGFEVQRRDDEAVGDFVTIATTASNTQAYLDSGLVGDHAYSWRVRAVNAGGGSHWTTVVSGTTPPPGPSGLAGEALSPESAEISWADNSDSETGFLVERRRAGELAFTAAGTVGAGVTSFVDEGLVQKTTYQVRVRATSVNGASSAVETLELLTPAQLVITKARRKPAKGARPAVLTVSGRFDTAPLEADLAGAATMTVAGTEFPVAGFTARGSKLEHEGDGFKVVLTPSKSSCTGVAFTLTVQGGVVETLDPEGVLVLAIESGEFSCMGSARLSEGAFDPKKGIGTWEHPSLTVTALKVNTARPGRNTLSLTAMFVPEQTPPESAPDVVVAIGDDFAFTIPGEGFTLKSGKWVYSMREEETWSATLDPVKGTLVVKGSNLIIGEFEDVPQPLRIGLNVGDLAFEDSPIFVPRNGTFRF